MLRIMGPVLQSQPGEMANLAALNQTFNNVLKVLFFTEDSGTNINILNVKNAPNP